VARALLSGPATIRDGATNEWVCMPGVETGQADMCADPMGMQWFMDLVVMRKPKPTTLRQPSGR
jgi:hypothetical protein